MIINLISSPRNMSTALMYAFAQRPDMRVIDEPFYAHYLLGNKEVLHPGREEIIATQSGDADVVLAQIEDTARKYAHVFIKNMSHHLTGLDSEVYTAWNNIIFIRHPERIINSYSKVIPDLEIKDIGIEEVYSIFKQLSAKEAEAGSLHVLSAIDLVNDPEGILTELCRRLQIPFYQEMLSWRPGPRPEDGVWAKYWYKNVHESNGIHRKFTEPDRMPSRYMDLLDACLPMYEELNEYSIKS